MTLVGFGEPWFYDSEHEAVYDRAQSLILAGVTDGEFGSRLVECVNALAGLADPSASRALLNERGDLLHRVCAVLNGDGGHYESEHGTALAVEHGIESHYERLMLADSRLRELARADAERAQILASERMAALDRIAELERTQRIIAAANLPASGDAS